MLKQQGPSHTYVAKCDGCGDEVDTGLTAFPQAKDYLSRVEGWRYEKRRGVSINYCPRCAEAADDIDIVGLGFTRRPAYDE
jgi:hypothetical protein